MSRMPDGYTREHAHRVVVQNQFNESMKGSERADVRNLVVGQIQIRKSFQFVQRREILDLVVTHRQALDIYH